MTKEEREKAIEVLNTYDMSEDNDDTEFKCAVAMALEALDQEPSRDMEEIAEVMNSDADAETKCEMIFDILTAKPHYFKMQEPKESGDRE